MVNNRHKIAIRKMVESGMKQHVRNRAAFTQRRWAGYPREKKEQTEYKKPEKDMGLKEKEQKSERSHRLPTK